MTNESEINICKTLIIMWSVTWSVIFLQSIENDMDEMMKCFDELNDFGLELVQYIGNDEAGIQSINAKLQECQERWDSLVQLMEQNGKEVCRSFSTKWALQPFRAKKLICPYNFTQQIWPIMV